MRACLKCQNCCSVDILILLNQKVLLFNNVFMHRPSAVSVEDYKKNTKWIRLISHYIFSLPDFANWKLLIGIVCDDKDLYCKFKREVCYFIEKIAKIKNSTDEFLLFWDFIAPHYPRILFKNQNSWGRSGESPSFPVGSYGCRRYHPRSTEEILGRAAATTTTKTTTSSHTRIASTYVCKNVCALLLPLVLLRLLPLLIYSIFVGVEWRVCSLYIA